MTTSTTPTYVTPWVDGTRASHAHAPSRALGALERLVAFDALSGPLAARPLGKIEHVLPSPDGAHVVLRGADAAWIFDVKGAHVGSIPLRSAAGFTFVTRTGVFHQLSEYDWAGQQGKREVWLVFGRPGRAWATHVDGDVVSVVNHEPVRGNNVSRALQRTVVAVGHFVTGSVASANVLGAVELENTYGLGAIAKNGEIAVLTTEGRLRVYAPEGNDKSELKPLHASHVQVAPYDVSIVDGSIAALESVGVPPVDDAEWHGPYQEANELCFLFSTLGKHWHTRLHVMSLRGAVLGQVTVPFEVLQPPVDGGGGRTYLAGMGFAAIQHGKVLWMHAPTARTLVASFEGGEVALTTDGTLRIVDRDGNVRQSFSVGKNETIATPPAIAADGAVWVATEAALYVAR